MTHLDEHNILSDGQQAFRKRNSCETQLIMVINDRDKILDEGGQVDTFIVDFGKAFDTPPHELLKWKLYGIGGKTLKWIDSFLCFRQQRVIVNGVKSDWDPVLSGVPQGTILRPFILFSLYFNDISTDIDSEIRLFADDCVSYREIKDTEDTVSMPGILDQLKWESLKTRRRDSTETRKALQRSKGRSLYPYELAPQLGKLESTTLIF